jgi:hypothetical protein
MARNPQSWAISNPALGRRISVEQIEQEIATLSPRGFAVERLGAGDYFRTDGFSGVIEPAAWGRCEDHASIPGELVAFGFDVAPDRMSASIGVAGVRGDGAVHCELVESRGEIDWLAPRLRSLKETHDPIALVYDKGSAAESVAEELDTVTGLTTPEYASACGLVFDAVQRGGLRHTGQSELTHAVNVAERRTASDTWVWKRTAAVTPLIACTLAVFGAERLKKPSVSTVINPNEVLREMAAEGDFPGSQKWREGVEEIYGDPQREAAEDALAPASAGLRQSA